MENLNVAKKLYSLYRLGRKVYTLKQKTFRPSLERRYLVSDARVLAVAGAPVGGCMGGQDPDVGLRSWFTKRRGGMHSFYFVVLM